MKHARISVVTSFVRKSAGNQLTTSHLFIRSQHKHDATLAASAVISSAEETAASVVRRDELH